MNKKEITKWVKETYKDHFFNKNQWLTTDENIIKQIGVIKIEREQEKRHWTLNYAYEVSFYIYVIGRGVRKNTVWFIKSNKQVSGCCWDLVNIAGTSYALNKCGNAL